jgi:hypothetical protein
MGPPYWAKTSALEPFVALDQALDQLTFLKVYVKYDYHKLWMMP